jgi:hypothetical protein
MSAESDANEYDMGSGKGEMKTDDAVGYDYGVGSGEGEIAGQEVNHSTDEFGMGSGRPSDQAHSSGSFAGKLKDKVESVFHHKKHSEHAGK